MRPRYLGFHSIFTRLMAFQSSIYANFISITDSLVERNPSISEPITTPSSTTSSVQSLQQNSVSLSNIEFLSSFRGLKTDADIFCLGMFPCRRSSCYLLLPYTRLQHTSSNGTGPMSLLFQHILGAQYIRPTRGIVCRFRIHCCSERICTTFESRGLLYPRGGCRGTSEQYTRNIDNSFERNWWDE